MHTRTYTHIYIYTHAHTYTHTHTHTHIPCKHFFVNENCETPTSQYHERGVAAITFKHDKVQVLIYLTTSMFQITAPFDQQQWNV